MRWSLFPRPAVLLVILDGCALDWTEKDQMRDAATTGSLRDASTAFDAGSRAGDGTRDAMSSDASEMKPVDDRDAGNTVEGGVMQGCGDNAVVCEASCAVSDGAAKRRCWADADGDGFAASGAEYVDVCGDCAQGFTSSEPVAGAVDCDDSDAELSPNASETCGDDIDNDCNGMVDDGNCPICGDGKVTPPEECDPGTSDGTWACTERCTRKTIYRPCNKDSDCSTSQGEYCDLVYAYCTKPCSATPGSLGENSGCPSPGGALIAQCAIVASSQQCLAIGCNTHADCGVGSACVGSGTTTMCLGCDRHAVCSPKQCSFNPQSGSFGVCE